MYALIGAYDFNKQKLYTVKYFDWEESTVFNYFESITFIEYRLRNRF